MKKLRLVGVSIVPNLVAEDENGNLEAVPVAQPIQVKATDWPTYATEQFPSLLEKAEKELNA
jgi:hypothetical protein